MLMRLSNRLGLLHLSRRTVRLRLTVLFGALFLLSGIALLAISYVLVVYATDGPLVAKGPDGGAAVIGSPGQPPPQPQILFGSDGLTDEQLRALAQQLEAQAVHQRAADLRQFLIQSGIALAVMAVISIALGWIVAGRLLHHLRTITRTTQDISATNLHERLALKGPDDELKQLGDTIDGLLERLEASFRSQRQFVANASHELRTPLARQRTLGQVALSDPEAGVESLRSAHERILEAGRQQERLIEALLTLARSEGGLDRREPVDLAQVTDEVVLARRSEAKLRKLHLAVTLSPALTMGDRRLIERMVTNLVDNALRHNVMSGRVEVVAGTTRAGRAILSVANTGPTIPAPEVGKLFQPFQRLGMDRTRHDGGLGLGLSIVQAIATAHDAIIAANPRPTGGLEITVTLPRPSANNHPAHTSRPPTPQPPATSRA
jgi:signal transduction histidine kinase